MLLRSAARAAAAEEQYLKKRENGFNAYGPAIGICWPVCVILVGGWLMLRDDHLKGTSHRKEKCDLL